MKILQINSVCGIGSTGRIATDIHNILIKQGHESYIAFGKKKPLNCNNAISFGTKFDNYTHVVKTRILDKHGFGSKKVTIEFIKRVKELDPDIIHLHNIHGYYINIEILFDYLNKADKPIVWTLHDCWAFTGHCAHFDYIECEKWKEECFQCPQKSQYPRSFFIDRSQNNYTDKKEIFTSARNIEIVAPSSWLKEKLLQSFLKEKNVRVINNGIDLNIFRPISSDFREKNNLKNRFIILGVASKWQDKKGFKYFLELSKKLNHDEVIVMVGLSKQQLEKLPENILGIARTNSTFELAKIYSASDVFINPTLQETLGLTNIEAIACGTPVITFNTGGCPETIDESCGIVVEKGNLNALVEAIKLIKSYGKSFYLEDCVNRAKRFYDKDQRYNDYIELYKKVISKKELVDYE